MRSLIKNILSFFFLCFISSSFPKANIPPHIIILLHGNMDLAPHITSFENIRLFFNDTIEESNYKKSVELLRADPFFCLHHPMQNLGLQLIALDRIEPGYAAGAFVHAHRMITDFSSNLQTPCIYYTYGWSGLQSPKSRLADAQKFYADLVALVREYQAKKLEPKITIISYSHGANVALNLGAFYTPDDNIQIDQLILLGAPIIPESDHYVSSPLFLEIFNFYSMGDRVQPLDCLGHNRIFSGRRFEARKGFAPPANLYEVRLCIKRPRRTLIQRKSAYCTRERDALQHSHPHHIRKADPGHVEFWSFGWTNGYRKYFPLYPLPISAYSTLFTDLIRKSRSLSHDLLLDIRPYEHKIYLHDHKNGKIFPHKFLTQNELNSLEAQIKQFQPQEYSGALFSQHVKKAITQVQQAPH